MDLFTNMAAAIKTCGLGVRGTSGTRAHIAPMPNAQGATFDTGVLRAVLRSERNQWLAVTASLYALVCTLVVVMMCVGNTVYSPAEVWRILMGGEAQASALRSIWEYRLPRVVAAVLAGFAFGVAGNTFQTMLRNPLASPDVIDITSGSNAFLLGAGDRHD